VAVASSLRLIWGRTSALGAAARRRTAEWISQGRGPISRPLAEFLLPKLATGRAGRLQLAQGREASAFAKQRFQERLT